MKQKIKVLIVFFLLNILCLPCILSEETAITTITKCYNTFKVRVITNSLINYTLKECNLINETISIWSCKCKNPTNLILLSDESNDTFNFRLEYTTEKSDNIRIHNINDIHPYSIPPPPVKIPPKEHKLTVGVILVLILILIVLIYGSIYLWKHLMYDKEEEEKDMKEYEKIFGNH